MLDIGYKAVMAFITFIYSNKIIKKKMKEKRQFVVSNLLAVELHHPDISYRLEVPFHL